MGHTVLLVDDDKNVRDAMCRLLRNEPYRIISAANGEDALDLARSIHVHVIVADENMPGLSGISLLQTLRRETPDTMRIMLTGAGDFQLVQRAINEGEIYRFFTKPYNEIELGLAIRQAIQHGELVRESRRLLVAVRDREISRSSLEKCWPGISAVARDRNGAIPVEDISLSDLIRHMKAERERFEGRSPKISSDDE